MLPWLLLLTVLVVSFQWLHSAHLHTPDKPATWGSISSISSDRHIRGTGTSSPDGAFAEPAAGAGTAAAAGCVQQHAQQVLQDCLGLPGFCPRPGKQQQQHHSSRPAKYLSKNEPEWPAMAEQKAKVAAFLAGPSFRERVAGLQRLPDRRGILISAGKPHHVGNAAIILHVLRRQLQCMLPVEIAHRGDAELDPHTRKTLSREFPKVFFLDLKAATYPSHHNQQFTMDRYEPKIYALYHCRFQQVLLLDADNLPVRDPAYLFDAPHVAHHGAMFWMDLWSPVLGSTTFVGHDSVYRLLGLVKEAYQEELAAGQGWVHRVAESGQLVFDRVRHADVLEWLWWLTSFSSVLYKHVLGDKDTFGFAFATAHKLHEMYFVAVPPGAAFVHMQELGKPPMWRFHAMLQYDHLGQPAFFHRTFEKWNNVSQAPPLMNVVSGPLPNRFIANFLGNRTLALTPNLPEHVLRPVRLNCPAPAAKYLPSALHTGRRGGGGSSSSYAVAPPDPLQAGGCPLMVYQEYVQLREWGLPVARQPLLEATCRMQPQPQPQALGLGLAGPAATHHPLGSSSSSTCDRGQLWGQLSGPVWREACMRLRAQEQQQQQQGASRASKRKQLAASTQPPPRLGGSAARGMSGLLSCDDVAWPVARYVLREYAEAVATDSTGALVVDADPRLPVLQLTNKGSLPGTAGAQPTAQAPDALRDDPCGLLSGATSELDMLQRTAIPAAIGWVRDHMAGLPMLKQRRVQQG